MPNGLSATAANGGFAVPASGQPGDDVHVSSRTRNCSTPGAERSGLVWQATVRLRGWRPGGSISFGIEDQRGALPCLRRLAFGR
jgi:hypothetical protein